MDNAVPRELETDLLEGRGRRSPNKTEIGKDGSRQRLETPALIVDLPAMTRNIDAMARVAAGNGVALRPHVKAHKCTEIARRQIARGAAGVACATLTEAEVMVAADMPDVLITSPVVTPQKIGRLIRLVKMGKQGVLKVVADNIQNIRALNQAAEEAGVELDVLVDYDVGQNRTGAVGEAEGLALAKAVISASRLSLAGMQAYAGHIQHLPEREARRLAARDVHEQVARLLRAASAAGIAFPIVTGGGTGTHEFDAPSGVFTELQPGSYVFKDAEYREVLASETAAGPFETALMVQTSVVSVNRPSWVTVDGGSKCFATDAGAPVPVMDNGFHFRFAGDEHGRLHCPSGCPPLGGRVEFLPAHCDTTINLHNAFHVVEQDRLVAIWPIEARGL